MHSSHPDRRTVLRHGLAASASLVVAPNLLDAFGSLTNTRQAVTRPWLAAALKAEHWLAQSAQSGATGTAWPADPLDPKSVSTDLYNGMAGVVLFYLELHAATGNAAALQTAKAGANYLMAALPDEPGSAEMGLYTGVAGTAVVLYHVHRATNDERYLTGFRKALSLLLRGARSVGQGLEWNDSTDIISGSAGIGLTLLTLGSQARDVPMTELVSRVGDRLIERSQLVDNNRTWLISPRTPRNYPNFSHGTAGVSFFLTLLYSQTNFRPHLFAALAGERWLRSIATETPNGGWMIFHSAPGNEQVYYLSWCHGPAGTARLYRVLSAVTKDPLFDRQLERLALGIQHMKVPERSPGFWNNISQCCGNCGITEFFLALHRWNGAARHLEYAATVAHDTLKRATAEGDGLKWVQAEHRVRPELLVAQTGLMQGAAGVGLAMLHLDGALEGRKPFVRLPDDPF